MEPRTLAALASLVLGLVSPACAGPAGGGMRPADFSARTVDIEMGGLMGLPDGGFGLALILVNKTDDVLWVQVHFESPDPTQRCQPVARLEPAGSYWFSCPQRTITPDVDYPIHIRVFADAALTQLVESPETKFRFDQSSAQAFLELEQAGRVQPDAR